MEGPDASTVYGALSGIAAVLGVVLTARRGPRERPAEAAGSPPPQMVAPPAQPEGTWQVSPEMYRWFQDEMGRLHARVGDLEDAEREQRQRGDRMEQRGDRLERVLGLALTHIDAQDRQMQAAGIPVMPMSPELVAARDNRL